LRKRGGKSAFFDSEKEGWTRLNSFAPRGALLCSVLSWGERIHPLLSSRSSCLEGKAIIPAQTRVTGLHSPRGTPAFQLEARKCFASPRKKGIGRPNFSDSLHLSGTGSGKRGERRAERGRTASSEKRGKRAPLLGKGESFSGERKRGEREKGRNDHFFRPFAQRGGSSFFPWESTHERKKKKRSVAAPFGERGPQSKLRALRKKSKQ